MPNTYSQIYLHTVFAVQNRLSLINDKWRDELYKYITGIIQNRGHKMLRIGGMPDHVHIFFNMRPVESLSVLMRDVKSGSSSWINERNFTRGRFVWQEGFSAFSYSISQIDDVIKYIANQAEHHKGVDMVEEYKKLLEKNGIPYDERYIFKSVE